MSQALTVSGGGTYYVGEQPSDPMVLTVTDAAGDPVDLSDVSAVALVGDELPAGMATVENPFAGTVQYKFTAPFADSGSLTLQVAMTDTDGGVDYSAPFTVTVADPSEGTALLVTPVEVENWTGVPVSVSDIARAQGQVSVACGRDLSDPDWLGGLSSSDYYWLRLSVAYQAAEIAMSSGGLSMPYVPGATSIANGDVRVTYGEGGGSQMTGLNGMANAALQRLSWMGNFRSVQATPFSSRGPKPSAWTTISVNRGWPY